MAISYRVEKTIGNDRNDGKSDFDVESELLDDKKEGLKKNELNFVDKQLVLDDNKKEEVNLKSIENDFREDELEKKFLGDFMQIPWILRYAVLKFESTAILDKIEQKIGYENLKICLEYPLDGYPVIFHAVSNSKTNWFQKLFNYRPNHKSVNKDGKTILYYIKTTTDIKESVRDEIIKIYETFIHQGSRIVNPITQPVDSIKNKLSAIDKKILNARKKLKLLKK